MATKIEWTRGDDGHPGETWNPTTGCDRVSPGCDNCYALDMAKRLRAMGQPRYQRDGDPATSGPGFGVSTQPGRLDEPLQWRKPRRVFVDSMGDLFHDQVPDEFIWSVWVTMARTPQHTYQLLTKRHGRMRSLLRRWADAGWIARDHRQSWNDLSGHLERGVLPNVWLGVSVEDQKRADLRIPALLGTPAAVRFLSCEPLLGPVDLTMVDWNGSTALTVLEHPSPASIGWVIVGGESGPRARPTNPDWVRSLRDQCEADDVPFFFKQWGEWAPAPWSIPVCDPTTGWQGTTQGLARAKADSEKRGATHVVRGDGSLYDPGNKPWSLERVGTQSGAVRRWGKTRAGRMLDHRTHDAFPERRATVPA